MHFSITNHKCLVFTVFQCLSLSIAQYTYQAIITDPPAEVLGLEVLDAFDLALDQQPPDTPILPSTIEITFPDGEVLLLEASGLIGPNFTQSYNARTSQGYGFASISVGPQEVFGVVNALPITYFIVGPNLGDLTLFLINPSAFPREADYDPDEFRDGEPISVNDTTSTLGAPPAGSTIDVDLLVVFTPAAALKAMQSPLSSSITDMVNVAVNSANGAYINSDMIQRLNLVGMEQIDYIEGEGGDHRGHLALLNGTNDGTMDAVHRLRDRVGADIVVLIVDDNSSGGRANLHTVSGNADDDDAFAVVDVSNLPNYGLPHEIGHIGGAHHDRGNDPWPVPLYAHGLVNEDGKWRTIMAYDQCQDPGQPCVRIPYFSNPDVLYTDGRSTGRPATADNHRRLNETASTVSRFRISGPRISFYEGNNATQDHVCVIPTSASSTYRFNGNGDNRWCDNDEARSLAFYEVPAGTTLYLYDDPSGNTSDDWVEITALQDLSEYVVSSFERISADGFVSVAYHRANGLDGKVSLAQISSGGSGTLADLFEGNHGTQNRICTVALELRQSIRLGIGELCPTDEARSLRIFNARVGQVIRLYDSPSGDLNDDWTQIEIVSDTFLIEVNSFDSSFTTPSIHVQNYYNDGLDGKVSFIEIVGNEDDSRVELYEGNNLSQDFICLIPANQRRILDFTQISPCPNDEARSVLLRGLHPGQVVLFFDSPSGSREDDWTAVEVLSGATVTLQTFEQSFTSADAQVLHFRNNGLDGQVSRVEVHDSFDLGSLLSLYEGSGGSQNKVCDINVLSQIIDFRSSTACENDEVRSIVLTRVQPGTQIRLFDDPDCETEDDWVSIEVVGEAGQYTVANLETSYSDSTVDVVYHGESDGLNGKVSCIYIVQ